jgi:PAS domain S-box-containing protein
MSSDSGTGRGQPERSADERRASHVVTELSADPALLLDAATRIATATTVEDVAAVVSETLTAVFGASESRIALTGEGGPASLRVVAATGDGDRTAELTVEAGGPLTIAARSGIPCLAGSLDEIERRWPQLGGRARAAGVEAIVAIPLVAHEHILGAFEATYRDARTFLPGDRLALEHLGRQAGAGLFRVRTTERERAARMQLQQQATELRIAAEHLEEQATEYELTAEELRSQSQELEERNAQLIAAHDELEQSARRFRALAEALPVGVLLYHGSGTVAYANQYASSLLDRDASDIVSRDWRTLVHPKDLTRLEQAVRDGSADSRIVEFRFLRSDGRPRWVGARHGILSVDRQRGEQHVLAFGDVTERRQHLAALEQSAGQLREAMRISRIGSATRDMRTGQVTYSPEMYELVGADPSEPVTDETFMSRLPPDEAAEVADAIRRLARGQPIEPREFHVRRPDGSTAVLVTRANLLPDETGELTRLLITAQDITQQRASEAERAQLEAQLRQAQKMEAVGQLAGGIAHDFNNLLMIMLGNLELIEMRTDVPEAQRAYLNEVHAAAERAIRLTRQLLTFSRRASPRVRAVDMNEVIAHAESLLKRAIGETNAIVLALDTEPCIVRADAGQMEQILLNLVVNARDAMRAQGIVTISTSRVTLTAGDRDRWQTLAPGRYVQLAVSDTGEGMPPEVLERVFDPFFTTKPLGQGTGLGLAMVYGIVAHAHGAVDVESSPGEGATFTILLPESEPEHAADAPAAPSAPRREGTVLLVEDEPAVRTVLRATLAKQGFRVVEAQHGRDALLVWRGHRDAIDVVVTDLRMPEMGGRALAAALREEAPDLPVIFMSGYDEEALGEEEAAGAGEAVLQKPFATSDLVARITACLDARTGRT